MRTGLAILPVFAAPLMLQGRAFGLAPVPVASRGGAFVTRLLFVTASLLPLVLGGIAVEKMWLVLAALMLHGAAILAEVWRGALAAVPGGQAESAVSFGLTHWQGLRLVVWPQGSTHRPAIDRRHHYRSGQGHLARPGDRGVR